MSNDDEERHCEAVALREADERNYCLPEPEDVEWLADILARERASSRAQALEDAASATWQTAGAGCTYGGCRYDNLCLACCVESDAVKRIRALKGKP